MLFAKDGALRSRRSRVGGLTADDERFLLMYYTYRLKSIAFPNQFYVGSSSDLKRRFAEHNSGKCPHTSKYMPWAVDFYCALSTLEKAQAFERYLKSGSGHEFARRHF